VNNQPFLEPKLEAGADFGSKVNELLQDFSQKGEVRRFTLTAQEAYEGNIPDNLNADQKLIMEGTLVEILPNEDAIQSWQVREMERRQQAQYDIDFQLIDEYLAEKGIEAQTTESGLRYVIKEKGNGKKAKAGDLVAVHYAGFLLDGSLFDTSIKSVAEANNAVNPGRDYAPLEFNVGAGMVIKGWDEGLMLVEEGGSATLYIPSPLAYGSQARGNVIPANAILIFDVELVEIK
jgi:FKBP-type peptidyl-prolyl cis-trans isomerase